MHQLEFRKVIQIGYRFDQPEAVPILGGDERPLEPVKQRYTATIAFWLPAPQPFRRCAGKTRVASPYPHELEALRDGAIVEHVQDFDFDEEPSIAEMARRLMPVWEGLAADSLGVPFNGVPLDTRTKPVVQFNTLPTTKDPGARKVRRQKSTTWRSVRDSTC